MRREVVVQEKHRSLGRDHLRLRGVWGTFRCERKRVCARRKERRKGDLLTGSIDVQAVGERVAVFSQLGFLREIRLPGAWDIEHDFSGDRGSLRAFAPTELFGAVVDPADRHLKRLERGSGRQRGREK